MTRTATPTRPALADPDVSDEDLAAQPVGYWSGVVNRAVIRYLRDTMASVDLTQPLWWALNRLVAAGGDGVTREALTGGLVPLADDPDEVPRLPERLLHRGWATEDEAGLLRPTGAAAAAHARGRPWWPRRGRGCTRACRTRSTRRRCASCGGSPGTPRRAARADARGAAGVPRPAPGAGVPAAAPRYAGAGPVRRTGGRTGTPGG